MEQTPINTNTDNDNLKFTGSAPGKIIISGEHAVVYGHGAIAVAIDLKTTCITDVSKPDNVSANITLDLVNMGDKVLFDKNKLLMINVFVDILKTANKDVTDTDKVYKSTDEFIMNYDVENFIDILKKHNHESVHEKLNDTHFLIIFNLVCAYVIIKNNSNIANEIIEFFNKFILSHEIIISISSTIPHNAGLGSSAAYNVSLVSSLMKLANHILQTNSNDEILKNKDTTALISLSYAGEKLFHAKPSGIDNVTSIFGGVILFKTLQEFTILKSAQLFLETHFDLYLVDTKIRRDTKTFIAKVTDFKKNYEQIFLNCANSISYIVDKFYNYMQSESTSTESDLEKFYKMVEINQNLLQIIQVSCNEIDEVIHFLKVNKISSKLTGAGGGGFVLAFLPQNSDQQKKLEKLQQDYPFTRCIISTAGSE